MADGRRQRATKGGQQVVCATIVKRQPDVTITNNGNPNSVVAGDLTKSELWSRINPVSK